MIGSFRALQCDGGNTEIAKRLHPCFEDRLYLEVLLYIDAAYASRAVVIVEVSGNLVVLRFGQDLGRLAQRSSLKCVLYWLKAGNQLK